MANDGILDEIPILPQNDFDENNYNGEALDIKSAIDEGWNYGVNFTVYYDFNWAINYFLQGLIDFLRIPNVNYYRNHKYLILRLKYDESNEDFYIVNHQTINDIIHILRAIKGDENFNDEDYRESDQAILHKHMELKCYSLEWYDGKRPKKTGGYFPYYNKNQNLDLCVFGIYHRNDVVNYNDNCFILLNYCSNKFKIIYR